MEVMTLILFLTISVLISAVIAQITPKVTLPLAQIGFGVLIAIFASNSIEVTLDSDVFLVVFIAPLLYIEAKHADKMSLWKERGAIFGLAIGLVVLTSFIIGWLLHSFVPMISMAAALALGAALGPTDAVAVTALSKTVDIPEKESAILGGELLLNDASGIVMFQMALSVATLGYFSIYEATTSFLIEFFGGLIVGAIFGFGGRFILRQSRNIGIDSTVFHVLFELCMPFVVYLASTSLHVSGIIAVVVAGLVDVIGVNTVSPAVAKMNIVSNSVWEVLSFALNGIVFVMLGTQLPKAIMYVWEDAQFSNVDLVIWVVLCTMLLYVTRFLWSLISTYFSNRKNTPKLTKKDVQNSLIVTLAGVKGTITLSILFTLPYVLSNGQIFGERNILIFIGCGVILVTLLVATFVLPIVAPKPTTEISEEQERKTYFECLQIVLRGVIEQLTAEENDLNRRATRSVILSYQRRLNNAKMDGDEDNAELLEMRAMACRFQQERVEELLESGEFDEDVCYTYLETLRKIEKLLLHGKKLTNAISTNKHNEVHFISRRIKFFIVNTFLGGKHKEDSTKFKNLRIASERYALSRMKEQVKNEFINTELASKVVLEYEKSLTSMTQSLPSVTVAIDAIDASADVQLYAYSIELDKIHELQESGKLSRSNAKKMRENVTLMQLELQDAI